MIVVDKFVEQTRKETSSPTNLHPAKYLDTQVWFIVSNNIKTILFQKLTIFTLEFRTWNIHWCPKGYIAYSIIFVFIGIFLVYFWKIIRINGVDLFKLLKCKPFFRF